MSYAFNATASQEDAAQAQKKGNVQFFDIKPDSGVFFYLLPPFSARGRIVRHVQKVWLPEIRKTHVLFATYGLSEAEDPVLSILDLLEKEGKASKADYKARTTAYGNALVVSEGKVGAKFAPVSPPEVRTIGFPAQIGATIVNIIVTTPEILDPRQSSSFYFERQGEGLKTKYSVTLCGQQSPDGFERKVEDLEAKYGKGVLELFEAPPDLDKLWTLTDKTRERATTLAKEFERAIRTAQAA